MCSIIVALLLMLSGFLGYSSLAYQTSSQEPSTVDATPCAMPASREDITDALDQADDIFDPSLWTVEITNGIYTAQTTISWLSSQFGAVAFLYYLHYDCGVPPGAIRQYLSPEGFDTIFENYRPYEQTDHCKMGGTELYEFDVVTSYGEDAHALFWVKQTSSTRVVMLNFILPTVFRAKQADYGRQLFPELPACAAPGVGNFQSPGDSFRKEQER